MKKPKSRAKRIADHKRAAKRGKRFKDSRKKVAKNRELLLAKRRREKEEYEKLMAKFMEARLNGEF